MKLFFQILVPILAYLGIGAMGAQNAEDWRYVLLLPFFLVGIMGVFTGLYFFINWLY
jgi:hypothetical protein